MDYRKFCESQNQILIELEAKKQENKKLRKKKKLRKRIQIIVYPLILFVIIDLVLIFFATPVLKKYIQRKVHEKTSGLFSLEFNKISVELGTRRIALKDFNLIADTAVYNQLLKEKKADAALYNIACGSIEIRGLSIIKLLTKSKLKASRLILDDPIVELKKLPSTGQKQTINRDFVHQDLYPLVSKYVSEIKIEKIKLDNGKFLLNLKDKQNSSTTHIGYVDVMLYRFLLNKQQFNTKKQLFYAEDLQLQISQYRTNLNDKIHFVYADTVKISTKSSNLKVINAGVEPISKLPSFLKQTKHNYIHLKTPLVDVNGFNISNLYFQRDVVINEINIIKPDIKAVKKITRKKINNKIYEQAKSFDLTTILNKNLNSIKINALNINNAQLSYFLKNWNKQADYTIKSLNVQLNKFDLNKNVNRNLSKLLYSESLKISIDEIKGKLPDRIHKLQAKNIVISTINKSLKAKKISVKSLYSAENKNNINLYIPELKIAGVNYKEILNKNMLHIYSIDIAPSIFELKLKKKQLQDSNSVKKRKISVRKMFFKDIIIKKLNVGNSKFYVQKAQTDSTWQNFGGNIQFLAQNCILNQKQLEKNMAALLELGKCDIKLSNYHQDLRDLQHILVAKSVHISNIDSLISVSGFKLYNKDFSNKLKWFENNKIFDFDIVKTQIKGIDIYKFINGKELIADEISIKQPQINIYNNIYKKAKPKSKTKSDSLTNVRDILHNYFKVLNINNLELENAKVKISDFDSSKQENTKLQTKINLLVHKFKFIDSIKSQNTISYSNDIQFSLSDFSANVVNKHYKLKFKKADFSAKDSVFTANIVRLFPDSSYQHDKTTNQFLIFYSPLIQSKSISIKEFLDANVIDLGNLIINNPSISLHKNHVSKNLKVKKAKQKKKKSKFNRLIAKSIRIKNGAFGITHHSKNKEELLTSSTFNMELNNLNVDFLALKNLKPFLSNLDFKINLQKVHFQAFGKKTLFDIEYCDFNNKIKKLNAYNLKVAIGETSMDKPFIFKNISVNKIALSGFESGEFALDKNFIADELIINKPYLEIFRQKFRFKNNGKKEKITELNLYNKIRPALNSIKIGSIKTNNAKLQLTTLDGFDITQKIYNQIFADISGLIVDSVHQNDGRLLAADDITIQIKNYSTDISNNLYRLYVKDFGFSTGKRSIFAHSLSINPNMNDNEYLKLGKEFKINYLQAKKIEVNKIDLPEIIEKGNFIANDILLDSLQFHTYKNKKFPGTSVIKPALPLDFVWKAKRAIRIDSLKIRNSYIGSEIMMKNAKQKGFLDLTGFNANITNITNIPEVIEQNPDTKVYASTYLMGSSLLQASFDFPINSAIGEYRYKGSLQRFNMPLLNPYVENAFFVSIKSGIIDRLSFDIIANEEYASGYVTMFYKKLKLGLISKKKSDSLKTEKRGLFSMVANSIVRNKNRRMSANKAVYFERNIYKSAVNYWVLSVLSGVRNVLGFKSKQLKWRLKQERSYFKSQILHQKRMKRWENNKNKKGKKNKRQ